MRAVMIVLLFMLTASVFAVPRIPLPRRTILYVPWKTVAAGGAAAGTMIAAYKISNGVEDGLKTVAQRNPEAFSDTLSDLTSPLRWTLWLDGLSQEQLNGKILDTFALVSESVEAELHGTVLAVPVVNGQPAEAPQNYAPSRICCVIFIFQIVQQPEFIF